MNLQKGLVGHWTMDDEDTSGSTIFDSSGYDFNGQLVNNPSTNNNSIIGDSYSFDGSSHRIDTNQNKYKIKTVAFWIKKENKGESFSKYNSWGVTSDVAERIVRTENTVTSDRIYTRWIVTPESAGFRRGGVWSRSGSYSYADGNWHHYASTFDGDVVSEYFDGDIFTATTGIGGSVPETSSSFSIIGNSTPYNCSDVRIYNRTLSEEEVSALYNMRSQRNASI